jgi:hypothetical protein
VQWRQAAQGEYKYRVECTDKTNTELNGKEKSLSVAAYQGDNPLLKHGFVKASPGQMTPARYLPSTSFKADSAARRNISP